MIPKEDVWNKAAILRLLSFFSQNKRRSFQRRLICWSNIHSSLVSEKEMCYDWSTRQRKIPKDLRSPRRPHLDACMRHSHNNIRQTRASRRLSPSKTSSKHQKNGRSFRQSHLNLAQAVCENVVYEGRAHALLSSPLMHATSMLDECLLWWLQYKWSLSSHAQHVREPPKQ